MPLFEYHCQQCGTQFEELVLSSNLQIDCPDCGASEAQKQLSVFASSAGRAGASLSNSCQQPACNSGFK